MTQRQQKKALLPEIKDMTNSPQLLNMHDRAFWVLGWNECRDAAKNMEARIAELEAELEAVGAGGVQALRKQAAAPQAVPGIGALYALQEAEAALELAIHRILKRDPSHAVHVTSEAKALVAVRAALDTAAPAHPAEGVPEDGFELWWADHMPKSTQTEAWSAWVALHKSTHPTQQGLEAGSFEQSMSDWAHGDAKDAARYQWLREQHDKGDDSVTIFIGDEQHGPGHLDEQVDEALAAQAKQGEQANG